MTIKKLYTHSRIKLLDQKKASACYNRSLEVMEGRYTRSKIKLLVKKEACAC